MRLRWIARAMMAPAVVIAVVPPLYSSGEPQVQARSAFVTPAEPEVGMAQARLRTGALSPAAEAAASLEQFLESYESPMAPHAADIVIAAARYEVDHRLVVAIAGVESTFGRNCRGFNAWGWNNGATRWTSWPASIDSYTKAFALKYPDRADVKRFARRYNPNTPKAWASKVAYFMTAIDRTNRSN